MNGNQDPLSVITLTITQVVTLKLKKGNYFLWKLQIEHFLSSKMLLGSSTEAEYRTLSDIAAELEWIGLMMKNINLPQSAPAEIYCNNFSAVYLTANPVLHRKSKHFTTHFHFAQEKVTNGTLIVKHIHAAQQLAYIFTKSLPQRSYYDLRFKLGVDFPPTSSLRGGIKPIYTNQAQAHQIISRHTRSKSEMEKRQSDATVKNKGEGEKSTVKPTHQ
ncbi:hypothetical protein YC2023_007561 [Brassica napus]